MSRKIALPYIVAILFVGFFCLAKNVHVAYASPYINIDTHTAYAMVTNGSFPNLVVLDVRTQSEFDGDHIYMAIWIPHTELKARVGELTGHEDHEIIVYCQSGVRSVNASLTLDSLNFTKVHNMLEGVLGWESDGYPVWIATVHNIDTAFNYDTVQGAIDAPETLNGHTIFVEEGTYPEHVIVDKSISLVGENRGTTIIDGNNTGTAFRVTSHGVTLKEFMALNCDVGISVVGSDSCVIINNYVQNCRSKGILVSQTVNCTIRENVVVGTYNGYGIIANSSQNILVEGNRVSENHFNGLGLLDSHNCTLRYNIADSNDLFGVWIDSSTFNLIYQNNIVSNGIQAVSNSEPNAWDNRLEGNYWNTSGIVDSDHNGIGDTPYIIDENNTDNYPLMGIFSNFNTSLGKHVNVISNSTIENLKYFESNSTIKMYVSNMTGDQTHGFVRISIPHSLITEPYIITIDGVDPTYCNFTLCDNGTHRWIYFEYEHSKLEIVIVPEFPSFILLQLLMTMALLVFRVLRRKVVNSPNC